MSSFQPDEQLVSMFRQERSATLQEQVARLFEEAREDVYRYLLTLGLYPPRAQEAAQEVFLRLYATMRKGEEIRNPRAWVFRVAHNLGLKIRARQHSEQPFDPLRRRTIFDFPIAQTGLPERSKLFWSHWSNQWLTFL